jgi:hypothetical protein
MIDPDKRKFLFKKLGYSPHSQEQWDCHESTQRFRILCCGRRWGKTTFGGNELTVAAMDHTDPGYYWIVGPNYVQGEKEFRVLYHNIVVKLGLGNKVKKQYNVAQGQMRIEMPWGTIIEVKSADRKDGLLGEGLRGVIMAEAARHDKDTWEMFIRPALSDIKTRTSGANERGWAIFTSTPRGHNWFQGLWLMGQIQSIHPDYDSWRLPSWSNKFVYPNGREDSEIKLIEDTVSPQFFAQEIAAEFTSFVGRIYDAFVPKVHVPEKSIQYQPSWRNYWVFDYGFADPFVCLDIMVDPEDNVYVWREYQERYQATWDHAHNLQNRVNPEGFHVDAMFGDPRGADAAATIALVLGQVFSEDVPREQGYEAIRRWLKIQPNGKPKLFIDRGCTELIRQMEMLHLKEAKDGKNAPEEQHDYDDHGPDALRYFFSQYFVLGAGARLSDVYSDLGLKGEALTYFQQHTPFTRQTIGFGR